MADRTPFITYRFTLDNGTVHVFPVHLEPDTLRAGPASRKAFPDWTRLSACRCPVCPFDEDERPRCPIAERVVDLVEAFKDSVSTETALVEIEREGRTYSKRTTLMEGVSALLGVLMPTSGCPVLGRLKPNVLTHMPFATIQETIFRTLAMYLLAQFFVQRRGGRPDWGLKGLPAFLEDIRTVNRHFCQRFFHACLKDVSNNALVHLDSFAVMTAMATGKSPIRLDRLERLFADFPGLQGPDAVT